MYSVYQHWDPLKVCVVGKSYPPEFYSFIKNSCVRTVMERIAQETEEDYQKLITLLISFGVEILRPEIASIDYKEYIDKSARIGPPPMTPRDYTASLGEDFFIDTSTTKIAIFNNWDNFKSSEWPEKPDDPELIPDHICQEPCMEEKWKEMAYANIIDNLKVHKNIKLNQNINTAKMTRIGKDLYFGTSQDRTNDQQHKLRDRYSEKFPDYRCHVINTDGHADGTYCPVKPGLIVSLRDIPTYKDTFPGWEVVYLPGQSWDKVTSFLNLKEKNKGKWWVPGEELNDEFTDFVEGWLNHWVGYVEETVFDVNMLVIDEKNVVCNNYNKSVFDAFNRHGVTPHVINFRHRYFWDGGLHCITSDIHREGVMKDYFPERG